MSSRIGRPRDPELAQRVKDAAILILAGIGRAGLTMDEVAAVAGVGKSSIYRRWPTERALLVDVVTQLGVQNVDYGQGPGTARGDLLALLTCACTGRRAMAEVALLADVGLNTTIGKAYTDGPATRLRREITVCAIRAVDRGGPDWTRHLDVVAAAVTHLQWRALTSGLAPDSITVEHVVDTLVLPVIDRAAVTA